MSKSYITRAEIRKRVHSAWGQNLDKCLITFGYFEGHKDEATEVALHDLSHAFLLKLSPTYGDVSFFNIEKSIDSLPYTYQKDLQEVRALASEMLLIKKLRLNLCQHTLIDLGLRNIQADGWTHQRLKDSVEIAKRTSSVRSAAQSVLDFLKIKELGRIAARP